MLEIRHITKNYEEVCAVDDISFAVKDLERISIQGESGCGKSTLLGILAGLIMPDTGEVWMDGQKLPTEPHLRQMAMVFQDSTLWNHMTIQENILFGSPQKNRGKRRKMAEELADVFGIGGLLGRYPWQISGGQAKRAAIARAIACERKILLLDEPFSNLDKEGRFRTIEAVRELCAGKCAVLLVTHSAKEAEMLCERHLFMEEGKLKT